MFVWIVIKNQAENNFIVKDNIKVIDFIYEDIEYINKHYRKDYCTLGFLKRLKFIKNGK